MGAFADACISDAAALVGDGEIATAVTFTTAAGAATSTYAVLGAVAVTKEQYADGEYSVYRRSAVLEVAEVPAVTPQDTITIAAVLWNVDAVRSTSPYGAHTVDLVRRVRVRAQRDGYGLH